MADVPLTEVKSSTVRGVGYDAPSRTLHVQFHNGGRYRYHNVPADVHSSLLKSESIGKFMHARVRGKYRHEKM